MHNCRRGEKTPDLSSYQGWAPARQTDFVFSQDGKFIYIGQRDGQVLRHDVEGKTFLTPIALGGTLTAIDISADGTYLVVGREDVINVNGAVGYTILVRVSTSGVTVSLANAFRQNTGRRRRRQPGPLRKPDRVEL